VHIFLRVAAALIVAISGLRASEPLLWMVSWAGDPARSAVVDWHTGGETAPLHVGEMGSGEWREAPSESLAFPFLPDRRVFRARLDGLKSDTNQAPPGIRARFGNLFPDPRVTPTIGWRGSVP